MLEIPQSNCTCKGVQVSLNIIELEFGQKLGLWQIQSQPIQQYNVYLFKRFSAAPFDGRNKTKVSRPVLNFKQEELHVSNLKRVTSELHPTCQTHSVAVQSSEFCYETVRNNTLEWYGGGNLNSVLSHSLSIGFYVTWGNLLQTSQKPPNANFKDSTEKGNDANTG